MFLINSRYPLLSETSIGFGREALHRRRHTFFRSYGVSLLSSLATVLSSALVCSTRLPESVCGTVTETTRYEDFLGSMGSTTSPDPKIGLDLAPRRWMVRRICRPDPPTSRNRDVQHPDGLPFFVPPSLKRLLGGAGILTCSPSPTPFGLGLGTD